MPRRLPEKTRNAKRKQKAPIWKGQELEVVVDDIGTMGDGIARMHNYMIFVPKSKVGERVKVRIVSVGGKFAVAEKIA